MSFLPFLRSSFSRAAADRTRQSPRRAARLPASRVGRFDLVECHGKCDTCTDSFSYDLIHNGFNNSAYAYCDTCSRTALLDWYTRPQGVTFEPFTRIDKAVEFRLKPCSSGGRFTVDAQPRCPTCQQVLSPTKASSWIEVNASGTAKGWRRQQNWYGLYCIVIDGQSTLNPWI